MTPDQQQSIFAEVLLVEDNSSDENLILRALSRKKLANKVYVVRDGEESLNFILRRGDFLHRGNRNLKVILLDLKLPKINGLDVLKELRSEEEAKNIPVVALTSSNKDPDIDIAYNLGVNSYIKKPIIFEDFINTIVQLGFYWAILNTTIKKVGRLFR